MQDPIVIVHGARTPVGTFLGALSSVSAVKLGIVAAKGALERAHVDPDIVDAVFVGNVIQSSKDAVYLARRIGMGAGVPETAPALIVNRLCGSGLEALIQGAKAIAMGEARVVLAGGTENMSMIPYVMRGVRQGWKFAKQGGVDDALWSALTDPGAECLIGETVEHLADACEISREDADTFAARSQKLASAAQASGALAREIVPVTVKSRRKTLTVDIDQTLRPETSLEVLSKLPPIYPHIGQVCTAGNSSGLNDAAAMTVMTSASEAKQRGLEPLGILRGWGISGIAPKMMGLGPVTAIQIALRHAKLSIDAIDIFEINDAFAAQAVAVLRKLNIPHDRVNPNGGCLALGHPMGASGTRMALSALMELQARDAQYALVTLCIGGGMGIAAVFERAAP